MNTIKVRHGNTRMVAHRGCSGLEKENTHAAFVAAGNRSYWGIETDIHVTRDGRFVCFHDDNTQRVSLDNMVVEESTYDTLRNLLLTDRDNQKGRTDLRIPSLQEYVRICKKYGKIGVLELKNAFSEEDIRKVIAILQEEEYLDGIVFISFFWENMTCVRRLLPQQTCQFLTSAYTPDLPQRLAENHLDLDIAWPALTKEAVDQLHESGITINCWTVDDPEKAAQLIEWGVDFITSNILE